MIGSTSIENKEPTMFLTEENKRKIEITPSNTSADTNIRRPEQTYCGTEYGMIT